MKYKVGDKVKLRDKDGLEKIESQYVGMAFRPEAYALAGSECTIRYVIDEGYVFDSSPWCWSENMIEGLAEDLTHEEKPSEVPEAVILNGADVMRALKQFKVPSETIEQVKGDVERNYRKAIIEEQEKINEGLKENDKRKKRMKELYKGEQWSTEFECPDGYDFRDENGNVIEAKKIVLKKKPKYPQSYEECCKVMNYCCNPVAVKTIHKEELIRKFQFLLMYRDAYWKIAGDWKLSIGIPFYYLYYNRQLENIKKDYADDIQGNVILAFPTEEMRDAFYENFKELIEDCKELL